MADATARALVYADAQGLASHGVSRVPQYATHLANGRADGAAQPRVVRAKGGAVLVDARCGLAFPACALAVDEAIGRAREFGVAFAGVTNSHHFGAAAYHLEPVGAAGLVGLAMGNSPAAMAAAGGRRPLFGTNPIAAVFPRRDAPPLVIDLSLSEVARGKLMVAAKEGRAIPLGWALDADGQPTTDPKAGLEGSMLPMGGTKGAMLALVVELLVTALTGAAMGFEASSFFVDEGNRPRLGQAFLVIDPDAFAGRATFLDRVETLIAEMAKEPGVRLPGARRRALADGGRRPRRRDSRRAPRAARATCRMSIAMNSPTARPVALLLNVAHAIDHMFLLIFATAVAAIAADFGFADWESLMPYGVGAFMLFGLGSLPAGRLGDLWGRRQMMLVFFFGMGASALLVARHAQCLGARRRADADGRVLVDLPSGRHSDARPRRAASGPRDRRQRPRRQSRRRACRRDDGLARQVRRAGARRSRCRRCSRSPAA